MSRTSSSLSPFSSLSASFSQCLASYKRFLLALSKENCRAVHLQQVNLPEILEEYGRLKIWGDQTKATLPEKARGSLDDILRNDASLKDVVFDILCRLRAQLELGS